MINNITRFVRACDGLGAAAVAVAVAHADESTRGRAKILAALRQHGRRDISVITAILGRMHARGLLRLSRVAERVFGRSARLSELSASHAGAAYAETLAKLASE